MEAQLEYGSHSFARAEASLDEPLAAQHCQGFVGSKTVQKFAIAFRQMLVCLPGHRIDRSFCRRPLLSLAPTQIISFFIDHGTLHGAAIAGEDCTQTAHECRSDDRPAERSLFERANSRTRRANNLRSGPCE
jgi:hypothetical protein